MRPRREEQALREIGRTRIATATAAVLVAVLALTVGAPPLARWLAARGGNVEGVTSPVAVARRFAASLRNGVETVGRGDVLAGNRELLAAIEGFEDELESGSLLRRRLLPPTQLFLTARLGAGNEQAYVGEDGWLYYRPDVDHLTGAAFMAPDVLERRRRSGASWERAPQPDPLPALERFAADLGRRGIALWLLPTPVKPALEPDRLARRATPALPLRNPSWEPFRRRTEAAGTRLLDAAAWLAQDAGDEPLYLATDTHWTPAAMQRVAARLASELDAVLDPVTGETDHLRRRTLVRGRGDIATMLDLPAGQTLFAPQEVEVETVTMSDGRLWRPTPGAEVLLLGDSFTNVYSEAGLGWGQGAGLAEQLAYHLARPVDRIARNAGGSSASRRALVEALSVDPSRLDGTKVVVYQFAGRELSAGDWLVLPLP